MHRVTRLSKNCKRRTMYTPSRENEGDGTSKPGRPRSVKSVLFKKGDHFLKSSPSVHVLSAVHQEVQSSNSRVVPQVKVFFLSSMNGI